MSVVLHLSDTHFGTEQPLVLEALATLAAQQQPDVVVLSGDITQRARPTQFKAAKAFMDRMGAPAVVIPGNHDIALFDLWTRMTQPYGRFSAAFGPDLEPVYQSPDCLVVGVNTTRAGRHKHGEVSASQMARVVSLLAAATPHQLCVVVVHQPVAVPVAGERANLLRGHEAATRVWAEAGADLVLGGHVDLPFTQRVDGLARPLWVVQPGTAVGWLNGLPTKWRAQVKAHARCRETPLVPPWRAVRSGRPPESPAPGVRGLKSPTTPWFYRRAGQ